MYEYFRLYDRICRTLQRIRGGFVGGGLTVAGVLISLWWDKKKVTNTINLDVDAFCRAVAAELGAITERHTSNVGSSFESLQENAYLAGAQSAEQNYFIVFDANATMIGKMKDQELSLGIIRLYVLLKGHLDALKIYFRTYDEMILFRDKTGQDPTEQDLATHARQEDLVAHSQMLKKEYDKIIESSDILTKKIRNYKNASFVERV